MHKILILLVLAFVPFASLIAQESHTFRMPGVRDEFCGIEINYQYCKCAFHGDYCNAIGLDKSSARAQVMNQFRTWVGDMIESMGRNCIAAGNAWNKNTRTCTTAEEPEETNTDTPLEEQYNFPEMKGVPEPTKTGYYGKISQTDGDVFIYQWSFGRWVRAVPGQPIYHGDFIKTLNGTTRIIYNGQFGDDVLNLSTETMLETGRPGPVQRPASEFSLLGVVRDGVVDIYNSMQEVLEDKEPVPAWYIQMHTPNVATGRRGTHYSIAYDASTNETVVTLFEGVIDVATSNNSTAMLSPNEQVIITGDVVATTTITDGATYLSSVGLPPLRVDASAEELEHTAPQTPIDDTPAQTQLTREELVGDLSDIEKQFGSSNSLTWIILVLLLGGGGYWYYRNKQ